MTARWLAALPPLLLAAALAGPARAQSPAPAPEETAPADRVIQGGTIYTLLAGRPEPVEALALRDGEVVYAGPRSGLRPYLDRRTEVTDLLGAVAVPGLVDAHAHLFNLGEKLNRLDLVGTTSAEDCLERARRFALTLPAGAWLLGRGWDQNDWAETEWPTREILDAVFDDRPVAFERVGGHAVWCNSRALQAAGITAATPDPVGGEILRDEVTGEPTGILVDNAEDLVWDVVPTPGPKELDRILDAGLEEAARQGLTAVHEMGASPERIAALRRAEADGRLRLRMIVYLGGDEVLQSWPDPPDRPSPDHLLRIEGVKLYADGALGSRGAALLEDYRDRPGHRGLLYHTESELAGMVERALLRGYGVAIHAIGDAANRQALNALERGHLQARARDRYLPELGALHARIEHCQILDPQDIGRFATLGVIPSMQPTHCTSDMPWAPERLGPDRLKGAYAWRSLRQTGCILPLGSDFPVEAVSPLLGLYAATTRRPPDGSGPAGGWQPLEKLTPLEALLGFTSWPAQALGVPEWGRLSPGCRADITVLDRDPLVGGPEALEQARVLETIVEGKTVYRWP